MTERDLNRGGPPDAEALTTPDAVGDSLFGPQVVGDLAGERRPLHPADDPPLAWPPAIPGYRLIETLGRGGMAEVHLAEKQDALDVGIRCAIKLILPARLGDPRYRARLLDEARILARLRHPNIVSVTDAGEVGGTVFVVMDWMDGVDVAVLLERLRAARQEMPLRHVLYILEGVCKGLHHAHTAEGTDGAPLHIVHRDVSPGNILCSRQGAVALTDFGVAIGAPAQRSERLGTLSGKLPYFAPELFLGEPPSPASDLFALGVTLWEMLTVRPLFPRRLPAEAMRDVIARFHPDQLLDEDLTLPEPLEAILRRSLAPDPADRYPSADELLEDVSDCVYELGLRLLSTDFQRWLGRTLDPTPADGRRRLGAGSLATAAEGVLREADPRRGRTDEPPRIGHAQGSSGADGGVEASAERPERNDGQAPGEGG